jgi:hypothetical protein
MSTYSKYSWLQLWNAELRASIADKERECREKVAGWMVSHGFSTGHGDTLDDLLAELGGQVDTHRSNYMERIRERDEARVQLAALSGERQPPGTPKGMYGVCLLDSVPPKENK